MNNPNPFVPKGSLLEQQNKRRTHLKLGVYCVLAVSCAGLMAMLIQGCTKPKDESPTTSADNNNNNTSTSTPDANATSSNTSPTSLGPVGLTPATRSPALRPFCRPSRR